MKTGPYPVTAGEVKICELNVPFAEKCEDSQLVGTARLTAAGTASVIFIPPVGVHWYLAKFSGTNSAPINAYVGATFYLQVEGTFPTTTTIPGVTGSSGSYTYSSAVKVSNSLQPLAGRVGFLDQSHPGTGLGAGDLLPSLPSFSWTKTSVSLPAANYVAGDFNGDGILDVAGVNAGTLYVLFGNGSGGFAQTVTSTFPGRSLDAIAAGDLNSDGKMDLAVDDGSSGSLLVLLGNGDGTFGRPLPTTGAPSFAIGDFNHDGILDLAELTTVLCPGSGLSERVRPDARAASSSNPVVCQPAGTSYVVGTVTIQLGNGDGTFTAGPVMLAPQNQNYPIVAADFDGDGKMDLAWGEGSSGTIAVAFGNGDGSFLTPTETAPFGSNAGALSFQNIATADFDGYGRADLAVSTSDHGIAVMLIHGRTFTTTFVSSAGVGEPVLTGDFNADGIEDLVASSGSNGFVVFLGNHDGTFTQATLTGTQGANIPTIAADLNGDGVPDLIGIQFSGPGFNTQSYTSFITDYTQTSTATSSAKPPLGAPAMHEIVAEDYGSGNFHPSYSSPIGVSPLTSPEPVVTLSSTVFQFGENYPLSKSLAMWSYIVNTGSAPLQLDSFIIEEPERDAGYVTYTTSNGCPSVLLPGGACKVYVQFQSDSRTPARLIINDNAANSPQVITLLGTVP